MAEHSKEPWRVLEAVPGHGVPCRIVALDANIAQMCGEVEAEENARRIVACVNVLADVPIEDLESGAFEDLLVEYGKYLVSRPAGQDRSAT